jgi:hypothetical protein
MVVVIRAGPNLNLNRTVQRLLVRQGKCTNPVIATLEHTRQINALVMAGPPNGIVGIHGPHLILIPRRTFPNLKSSTV